MLVHLCLSVLLTVISLIVFICAVTYELINDDNDNDLRRSANKKKRLLLFFSNVGGELHQAYQSCDCVQPMAAALQNGVDRCVEKYESRLRRCVTLR